MIGVFTEQGIELDNSPAVITYNVTAENQEEPTELYKEKTLEESEFLSLMSTCAPLDGIELSDNQKFFFNQSTKSMYEIISIEKEYLKENDIEPPTQDVVNKATQLMKMLAVKNIHPHRIATSADDGICLTFKKGNEICYLELYNNGEMGYIIENRLDKTVIANEDLFSLNESINAIEDFYTNEISQIFTC